MAGLEIGKFISRPPGTPYPERITQAETIAEAFASARDAVKVLKQARAHRMRKLTRETRSLSVRKPVVARDRRR